jgi:choline dehydrogenase-like flavoprotein
LARKDFLRGYGIQGIGGRQEWQDRSAILPGFGGDFKKSLLQPGPWFIWIGAWAETLPYFGNKISLDANRKDTWGLPLVKIDMEYHDNEEAMRKDILTCAEEMLQVTGLKNIHSYSHSDPAGTAVHEMGTARMGRDPRSSVLNAFNQMHDVKNVFITDGSCMTSAACQNPSLTYMALTARACDFAVTELKKRNL